MKKIVTIAFCLISTLTSFGQNKMTVDKPFNGSTYYGEFSKHIHSLSDLPTVIQLNVQGYLKRILGSMADSVTFSHGQIVDLENMFKGDSSVYKYEWIVPKYDLNFVLKDRTIGILSYYIHIRSDEYGQIVYSNWPKKYHDNKSEFMSRATIEKFALKQAKSKGFDTTDYKVDLKFNEKSDMLCWTFEFPIVTEKKNKEYNVLEISWKYLEIINEYISSPARAY